MRLGESSLLGGGWAGCKVGSKQAGQRQSSRRMKKRTWLLLLVIVGIQASTLRADDLFQLSWRTTFYATNSSGHIIAQSFTEQDFVNQVSQNTGIDPSQLVLVYRPRKRDAAVVKTDGTFVESVVQMTGTFTDVVNPSGSVIVRQALLLDQAHDTPLGSFFGLELRSLSGSGALLNDSLVGTVLYSRPELNAVFGGQVSTGGRIVDTTNAP